MIPKWMTITMVNSALLAAVPRPAMQITMIHTAHLTLDRTLHPEPRQEMESRTLHQVCLTCLLDTTMHASPTPTTTVPATTWATILAIPMLCAKLVW